MTLSFLARKVLHLTYSKLKSRKGANDSTNGLSKIFYLDR